MLGDIPCTSAMTLITTPWAAWIRTVTATASVGFVHVMRRLRRVSRLMGCRVNEGNNREQTTLLVG